MKNTITGLKQNTSLMNRRDFVKTTSTVASGLMFAPCASQVLAQDIQDTIPRALDVPFRVKFVNSGIVHEAAFEGSCRVGELSKLTTKVEQARLDKTMGQVKSEIRARQLPPDISFLEPVTVYNYVEKGNPQIHIPPEQFEYLTRDDDITDLYVVNTAWTGIKIAQVFNKPVVILHHSGWAVHDPAAIRRMGIPSFHVKDWDQLMDIIMVFKAQKAFAHTKVLSVTNFPSGKRWEMVGCEPSRQVMKDLYDLEIDYVEYKEFFGKMDEIVSNKSKKAQAAAIADELIKNSGKNNMSKDDVIHSVEFYQTVRTVMSDHGCNAFTIECFELCSSMQTWNRRFTPCMTNALLKDNGIPATCEGDYNAMLAMMALGYLSRKAIYMGNPAVDTENNTLSINHSVASLNMNGIYNEPTPYDIHSFTKSGFGVTLRHDFEKDSGAPVTVARFDPTATKVLVTRGEITGGDGMSGYSCANKVIMSIPDGKTFWEESQDFGHHLTMAYGDYVDQIKQLGKVMKYKVNAVI